MLVPNATVSSLLPLALLLVAPAASAATYYVAPDGDPTSDASSRDAPGEFLEVIERLEPGDEVVLMDGVYPYQETTMLSRSGEPGAPITFRADEGAVPVFRGRGVEPDMGAIAAANDIGHLVFEGLWFEEWGSGGIELDWYQRGCHDITIRYCVADSNGRNGFAPYNAHNVTLEYNIASRNGYRPDSWSSNFNLWANKGEVVVRGNVSFHGVDTSSHQTDGNGYILDLTLDEAQALFENNIGFANGGACIAITDSGNATLIGNTCFNNAKAIERLDEFGFVDTCRGEVDGVDVAERGWTFSGLSFRNNVLVPSQEGKPGFRTSSGCSTPQFTEQDNLITYDPHVFFDAEAADFRPRPSSPLVDRVEPEGAHGSDIGFDPNCIKLETDPAKRRYPWWTHAPDLDYIRSIGGIRHCFAPRSRPHGARQDLGAYELLSEDCVDAGPCADEPEPPAPPKDGTERSGGCSLRSGSTPAPFAVAGLLALLAWSARRRHATKRTR